MADQVPPVVNPQAAFLQVLMNVVGMTQAQAN